MKRLLTLCIAAALFISCNSYSNRDFIDFEHSANRYSVTVDDGEYQFQFYTPEILEVHFIPEGESLIDSSHAVVMEVPKASIAKVSENRSSISIESEALSIQIRKDPFRITYFHDGEEVIAERAGFAQRSTS